MKDDPYDELFARPAAAPPPTGSPPDAAPVSTWEDVYKGAAGGLGRGVAGLAGIGGTVGNLARSGLSKLGVSDETLDTGAAIARRVGRAIPQAAILSGPDSGDVQKAIESYTGPLYQPKTVPGQYASTIAEFAPGMAIGGGGIVPRAVNTVAGALGSETAGQLTKGTAAEPYARFAGGVVGGVGGAKAITPAAAPSAARQGFVDTLEREGVPLTAGQRTGSKTLTMLESNAADMPLSAGRAAELAGQQANAYDQAVTSRLYDRGQLTARGVPEDVHLPDPRVVNAGRQSLSDEYDRVLGGNVFHSDPQLHQDIFTARQTYEGNALPSQRAGGARDLEALHNDIINKLVAGQGTMPGTQYQAIRSRFGELGKSAMKSDPVLGNGLLDMRGAIDRAMGRGLPPEDAMALRLNNQRWANMRQIEGAVARGGENLSPLAVAQTTRAGRPGQYAAQSGSLDELAKAGAVVLKPPPNSGTAARLGWQHLFQLPTLLASGGGGALGGVLGGPLGAVAGAAIPQLASRAVLSRPAQAYLANQALPQNARDVIAQTLAQQAVAQPSVTRQNVQERAAYERQRQRNRVQQGLPE